MSREESRLRRRGEGGDNGGTADIPEASRASFLSKSLPCCIARAFIEGLKFFGKPLLLLSSPAMEIAGAFSKNLTLRW